MRLAKEGEEGRKKIATITRYVTVILGLIQGTAYYFYLRNSSVDGQNIVLYRDGAAGVFVAFVIILTFTAGTALMMWMGEQINQKGIGNGISILLFAGIVARLPSTLNMLAEFLGFAIASPSTMGSILYLFLCLCCSSWWLSGSLFLCRIQKDAFLCSMLSVLWAGKCMAAKAAIFRSRLRCPALCRLSSQAVFFLYPAPLRCSWETM